MFHRYDYEAEFYPTLNRLPLDCRRKLDVTGIKLSLKDWQSFSFEERIVLCHLPCDSAEEAQAFSNYVDFLSRRYHGRACEKTTPLDAMLWQAAAVPRTVGERSAALDRAVTAERWQTWPSHARYALYKAAVSENQPEAFLQILNQLLRSSES